MSTEEIAAIQALNYPQTDQFLSEEDLDLKNLSWEELLAVWDAWLKQASVTDEMDARLYSHGVFQDEPL